MLPSILVAAEQIRRAELTPLELFDLCIANIDRYEQKVQAWVLLDRDRARTDAAERTAEVKRGQWRGPLHGIPLGIKDIIDVFDWPTAAGSKLWAQSIARRDATIVERLRHAGAVFLGKTVTTQFASYDPPKTRNPWDRTRTPGGSSSGSAAGLACGMCLGALGSQTGGSITRPAGFCGVPSIKPTYGRVSTDGILPLAPSMDHPGPFARTVADLAILMQVIAGHDPRDVNCVNRPVPHYPTGLRGASSPPRLGRLHGLFDSAAEAVMTRMVDAVTEQFRSHGATVIDVALPPSFDTVVTNHGVVMSVEASAYHKSRLTRHPDDYMPKIRALLEAGLACSQSEYARCKLHQEQLKIDIQTCFEGVDALLMPATTGPAPLADTTGDLAMNAPWSYTGLPAVSVPAAWTADGLPLSIQLVAPAWHEAELFAVAAWCERVLAFEQRLPPV